MREREREREISWDKKEGEAIVVQQQQRLAAAAAAAPAASPAAFYCMHACIVADDAVNCLLFEELWD